MFNLMKVKKSMGNATGRPAPSPPSEVPVEVPGECFPHGEERPDGGGSELPKKKIKVAVSKCLKKVRGTSKKDHHDKGKEPTEMSKLPRAKAEEPLKARWSNFTASTRV
ncbi:hypothetical protein GW17_00029472 [Ensete ventricosum]|nr:hypothetical protein GW17_00029472 [Ensete ventricosum]